MKNGLEKWKSYTPISLINQKNYFDLLIKIYRQEGDYMGGKITPYFETLTEEDHFDIIGPKGKFQYLGDGEFLWIKS